MKKVLLILTAIIVVNIGRGQSFEGTITLSVLENYYPPRQVEAPIVCLLKVKGDNDLFLVKDSAKYAQVVHLEGNDTTYFIALPVAVVKRINLGQAMKVTKTSKRSRILGYKCRRYFVEGFVDGDSAKIDSWVTTRIKSENLEKAVKRSFTTYVSTHTNIKGTPLRIVTTTTKSKITVEALAISKESVPDSLFIIPRKYQSILEYKNY